MFLTDIDYKNHQREEDLNILTNGNTASVRIFAEAAAQEEIRSYLASLYDVDRIFIDVLLWNNSTTYSVNDQVHYNDKLYYAKNVHTNDQPLGTNWTEGDLRNPLIVMRAMDIAIYHMYAKIPQRQTPEDVVFRYEEAIAWLKMVAKGMFKPNLPKLTEEQGKSILFGTTEKINWR